MPMILANHVIFCLYGFWLPNDPRGSGSKMVGDPRLYTSYGRATTVTTRSSVAHRAHDRQRRLAAKGELKSPPVALTGQQALEVASGVREVSDEQAVTIWACAVMPDHVHLVTQRHELETAKLVGRFRARASRRLHDVGLWPVERPLWAKGQWTVHLFSAADIQSRIEYVERNPLQAGLPRQRWSFVTPYNL